VTAPPVVVQLLGYPGTGKYTVAKELVRLMEADGRPARLLDNHASANLILSLVPTPTRGIPDDVMQRIIGVREQVIDTLQSLTPRDWSIVFTNFPPTPEKALWVDRHRELAEARGAHFAAVVLECDAEENLRRVAEPERAARHKLVNPGRLREILGDPLPLPPWDDIRRIDVTSLAPEGAARLILERLPS
jgi:AAA domain